MQASVGMVSREMCPHSGQVSWHIVMGTDKLTFTLIALTVMREIV
jgi:hypothetical protein